MILPSGALQPFIVSPPLELCTFLAKPALDLPLRTFFRMLNDYGANFTECPIRKVCRRLSTAVSQMCDIDPNNRSEAAALQRHRHAAEVVVLSVVHAARPLPRPGDVGHNARGQAGGKGADIAVELGRRCGATIVTCNLRLTNKI